MDVEAKSFGTGPKELGGATDLVSKYKLWPHYQSFCQKPVPLSISETRYLHNVVGDTEIRRGEGMELYQLFENPSSSLRERNTLIHHFDMNLLGDAFRLKETNPVKLRFAEKAIATGAGSEMKQKEKKRKKLERKSKYGDMNRMSKREKYDKNEKLKVQIEKMKMVNGAEEFPDRKKQRSLVADAAVKQTKTGINSMRYFYKNFEKPEVDRPKIN